MSNPENSYRRGHPLWRIFLVSLLGFSAQTAFGASVEAKKDGVKVHKEATNKSDVLQELKKGESLESTERQGMYWTVKMKDGQTGYVSVLKVKRSAEGESGLSNAIRSVVKQGRNEDDVAGARSRSAVMGVRGAAEDPEAEFAGNVKPNLRAVYFMEDLKVPEKRLEKLGELVFAEIEQKADAAEN